MDRRKMLGLLMGSAALGGCANSVMSRTVATAFENSLGGASAFDPDYPDRLPYASITVTMKNLRRALLVLAKAENGELHWMSSDRGVLVTRNGRLVRTVGLPENLVHTDFLEADFFDGWSGGQRTAASAKRLIDLAPGNRFGLLAEARIESEGREKVYIHTRTYDTIRFAEHCVVPQLSWKYTNIYWVGDTGVMWRSLQYVAPGLAPIQIDINKPFQES